MKNHNEDRGKVLLYSKQKAKCLTWFDSIIVPAEQQYIVSLNVVFRFWFVTCYTPARHAQC